jgi:hypothetical protein
MTTINETPGGTTPPETPAANPLTAAAQAKIAQLRAMGDDFPDDPTAKPLTPAEMRLAAGTPVVFMEKSALLTEAAPSIGGALSVDAEFLRESIAEELAYGGVIDEANAFARRVELYLLRRKLKAARIARDIYRMAQGYAKTDPGNPVTPHVEEMKRALRKKPAKRAKKAAAPPAVAAADTSGSKK